MIAPISGLRILDERPYPPKRLLKRIRERLINYHLETDDQLEADLQTLLELVKKCRDRTELSCLLGQPDYAISGKRFGWESGAEKMLRPDVVECYSKSRLAVELWYRDEELCQVIGYVLPLSLC